VMEDADGAEAGNKATSPAPSVQSQSTDYSTTNLQVT
jgi:hypothetical protein